MQGYAEPRQKAEKKQSAPVLAEDARKQAPDELGALLAAPSAESPMAAAESAPLTGMAVKLDTQEALMQLLELRRAGKVEEAQRLQQRLQLDYPQLDIEVQLERLEKGR
jgi:hypothetical protein